MGAFSRDSGYFTAVNMRGEGGGNDGEERHGAHRRRRPSRGRALMGQMGLLATPIQLCREQPVQFSRGGGCAWVLNATVETRGCRPAVIWSGAERACWGRARTRLARPEDVKASASVRLRAQRRILKGRRPGMKGGM